MHFLTLKKYIYFFNSLEEKFCSKISGIILASFYVKSHIHIGEFLADRDIE